MDSLEREHSKAQKAFSTGLSFDKAIDDLMDEDNDASKAAKSTLAKEDI